MVGPFDQSVLDGIGEGVNHFLDDVRWVDEADDAGLLGGPEVLPATAQGVLALGEELVEMLEKGGVVSVGVFDPGVMVVAHGGREDDANAVALGGDGETVDERVVGPVVGAHEELPLGATSGDHVGPSGKDVARDRQVCLSTTLRPSCTRNQPWSGSPGQFSSKHSSAFALGVDMPRSIAFVFAFLIAIPGMATPGLLAVTPETINGVWESPDFAAGRFYRLEIRHPHATLIVASAKKERGDFIFFSEKISVSRGKVEIDAREKDTGMRMLVDGKGQAGELSGILTLSLQVREDSKAPLLRAWRESSRGFWKRESWSRMAELASAEKRAEELSREGK